MFSKHLKRFWSPAELIRIQVNVLQCFRLLISGDAFSFTLWRACQVNFFCVTCFWETIFFHCSYGLSNYQRDACFVGTFMMNYKHLFIGHPLDDNGGAYIAVLFRRGFSNGFSYLHCMGRYKG